MNANTSTASQTMNFVAQASKNGKRVFASVSIGNDKACFIWPEVLRGILDNPTDARTLLAEIDRLNGVQATDKVIETLAKPVIPAATVASPASVVIAVSDPVTPKDTRPAKTPSVHTGTGADIINKSKSDRDDSNARIKAALVAEYKELGIKGYKGNPSWCTVETLRSRIAAHKANVAPVVPQPTIVKATTPPPVAVNAARKPIGEFVNQLADGREVYTCVFDDNTTVVEIFEAIAKSAA